MKNKKYNYLFFFAFLLIFAFLKTNYANALEIDLGLGANPSFPEYVKFLFSWGISLAGLVSVISFALGAISLMISADNAEMASSGKDRMKGAVLGLVLTLASYTIISTINPQLTSFNFPDPTKLADWPQPTGAGVYFYDTPDCSGDNSGAQKISTDGVARSFKKAIKNINDVGTIQAIKIINDPANHLYYGTILHKSKTGYDQGGFCSLPMKATSATGGECQPIVNADRLNVASADIFNINMMPETSGSGLKFYSEGYGEDGGPRGGYYEIKPEEFSSGFYMIKNPAVMKFEWKNTPYDPAWQSKYKSFQDRPEAIKFGGSYIVALYSSADLSSSTLLYCQTFTETVPTLKTTTFLNTSISATLNRSLYIIPTY